MGPLPAPCRQRPLLMSGPSPARWHLGIPAGYLPGDRVPRRIEVSVRGVERCVEIDGVVGRDRLEVPLTLDPSLVLPMPLATAAIPPGLGPRRRVARVMSADPPLGPACPHDSTGGRTDRLRRRECELPLRQPKSTDQVFGHDDRVFAGHQELVTEGHPSAHGLHDGVRRMATERAHVCDVHVEIRVPVDVGDGGAVPVRHEHRRVLVEVVHPGHRHAPWHRPAGQFEQRHGHRPFGHEARILAGLESIEAVLIDHGRDDPRRTVPSGRSFARSRRRSTGPADRPP